MVVEEPSAPTTILGDWYLKKVESLSPPHLLCVSERSLLPVAIPMTDTASLGSRLATAVGETLLILGVPTLKVEKELIEMRTVAYGPTRSRRVLGSHNQLAALFLWDIEDHPQATLAERLMYLAGTPLKLLGGNTPRKVTLDLFQSAAV